MAKKDKNQSPTANSVVNRDIIQRLNFLYQASVYLNAIPSSAPAESSSNSTESSSNFTESSRCNFKSTGEKKRVVNRASDLSKSYVQCMKIVAQKATVQMDPTVKRSLCKACGVVLVAGSTTFVRVKTSASHGRVVTYTCTECHTCRRIPAPPGPIDDYLSTSTRRRRSKKACVPPLFARKDAGHVLFRGNNVLEDGGETAFGA